MQPIIVCGHCQKKLRAPANAAGKMIRCPGCGELSSVPGGSVKVELVDDFPSLPPVPQAPASRNPAAPRVSAANSYSDPFASSGLPNHFGAPAIPQPRMLPKKQKANFNTKWLWIGGGIFVGCSLLGLVGIVVVLVLAQIPKQNPDDVLASNTNTQLGFTPSVSFPDLGQPSPNSPVGSRMYEVRFPGGPGSGPTAAMQLRVYLPEGNHPAKSLPCVLVAPAGTMMLHGINIDGGDYHDETLPYVRSKMAVVHYSLDGNITDAEQSSEALLGAALPRAYSEFRAAQGGILNGKVAIDYALAKIPEIDPTRIYSAGHSSAATVSLLLAANEPRIAAGIAYAPVTDLSIRLSPLLNDRTAKKLFPGLVEFIDLTSPVKHVAKYKVPLFLFHAEDDSNEPLANTERFAGLLKENRATYTMMTVPRGDHYDSMITSGIPGAISWLKRTDPYLGKVQMGVR